MANFRQRGAAKVRLAYAAVLDKPGQVFEPAIYGNLRVSPSESGFYGSQVRGIRIIGRLGFHQEVIALIKDRKFRTPDMVCLKPVRFLLQDRGATT